MENLPIIIPVNSNNKDFLNSTNNSPFLLNTLKNNNFEIYIEIYDNFQKGLAIKKGIKKILKKNKLPAGIITLDLENTYSISDIKNLQKQFLKNPTKLYISSNSGGAKFTKWLLKVFAGVKINDSKSTLRIYPIKFAEQLLNLKSNRSQFEILALIKATETIKIKEIKSGNKYISVLPFKENALIYLIILKTFILYILTSLIASFIDLILFYIFGKILTNIIPWSLAISTVFARVISATCNYVMDKHFVFETKGFHLRSGSRFFLITVFQMTASAILVQSIHNKLPWSSPVGLKIIIDIILFFVGYFFQKKFVFKKQ